MCDAWAEKDERIRVIHKENGGVSSARNAALEVATGDYIGFVDSDDWIEPDMYEYLIENTVKYNADISKCGLFIHNKSFFNDTDTIVLKDNLSIRRDFFSRNGVTEFSTNIYKSNILKTIRFNENLRIGEDTLFNYQVHSMATVAIRSFRPLYHYRVNENSVMHEKSAEKRMDVLDVYNYIWDSENENVGLFAELFDFICRNYVIVLLELVQYLIHLNHIKTEDYNLVRGSLVQKRKFLLKAKLGKKRKLKLILFLYFEYIYIHYTAN